MPTPGFSHEDLDELVDLLVEKLVERGGPVEVRIVGGAAIVLAHNPEDRGLTSDIDALEATNADLVKDVVREIADERGLPADWLNFKAQMFAPDPTYPEPRWDVVRERDAVRVTVANPQMLLAMKLRAGRGRRDIADIDLLLDVCEVNTVAGATEIFEHYYQRDVLNERVVAHLAQRFTPP